MMCHQFHFSLLVSFSFMTMATKVVGIKISIHGIKKEGTSTRSKDNLAKIKIAKISISENVFV